MTLSLDMEYVRLDVEGDATRAALYAGGTTGLLMLTASPLEAGFWAELGERAETQGFSALAYVDSVAAAPEAAAQAGYRLLRSAGVDAIVLVAAGASAPAALRAAVKHEYQAVVLVDSAMAHADAESLLADASLPKLALFAAEGEREDEAELIRRHAIGHTVLRHLPTTGSACGILGDSDPSLAFESILLFATRVCGDGVGMELTRPDFPHRQDDFRF